MGQTLFEVISLAIARDGAISGLRGRIAVGIRSAEGDRWWTATLDAPQGVAVGAQSTRSEADALFFMGEAEADSLAFGTELPEHPLLRIQGDQRLLRSFFDRYLISRSMLDLRATKEQRR